MARTENLAARRLAEILRSTEGIAAAFAQIAATDGVQVPELTGDSVLEQFVAPEVAEKAWDVRYPAVHVYCEKLSNKLREKFRTFSGTAALTVDVRTSHEHVEQLEEQLRIYVGCVLDVLRRNRGTWSEGMFYTGGYEVAFNPVKRGGKNYLQCALVRLEVQISLN